jgi:hypothetical protein
MLRDGEKAGKANDSLRILTSFLFNPASVGLLIFWYIVGQGLSSQDEGGKIVALSQAINVSLPKKT